MYFTRRPLIPVMLIGLLLASCGGQPAAGQPTADVNATIAAGAQTMVAAVFQTQTAAAPSATNTSSPTVTAAPTTSPLALPSPLATFTQSFLFFASATPTGTYYTATPNPNTLSYGCNNLLLIRSYTEPDGPFRPGQAFTQKWQVANTGTCDWLYLYELVFVGGDRLSGNSRRLSNRIEPDKWTTLSVDLEAPASAGTYSATWRFTDGAGHGFGSNLPVSIRVERNPDPTRTPTSTNTSPAPTNTPNLQQTLDGVNTAIACQTNIAGGTPPPCP
jgi:Ig-like domain from next to BRCA1 gene